MKVLLSLKSGQKPHLRASCWQNSVSKSRNLCDWREKQSQDFHPVFPRGKHELCWVRFMERECSLSTEKRDEHISPGPVHLHCLGGAAEHIRVSG